MQIPAPDQTPHGKTEQLLLTCYRAGLWGSTPCTAPVRVTGIHLCNASCESLLSNPRGKSSIDDLKCYFRLIFPRTCKYEVLLPEALFLSFLLESPGFYVPTEVFPMTTGAWGYLTLASRSSFRVTGEIHVILSLPKILVLCVFFSAIVY